MKFVPSTLKVESKQFGDIINFANVCPSCKHNNIRYAKFCENCAFKFKNDNGLQEFSHFSRIK